MRNRLIGLGFAAIVVGGVALGCSQGSSESRGQSQQEMIERGRHLVTVGDCSICHTPKVMTEMGPVNDSSLLLAGYRATAPIPEFPADLIAGGEWMAATNPEFTAWAGPWGISFAANLTPSQVFGSGAWTEETFIAAMRNGKHLGMGRPILPPMPWPAIAAHTDEELKAMLAFLKSIKPIENQVPQPIPPPMGEHAQAGDAHQ